jgi:hypothetical protein
MGRNRTRDPRVPEPKRTPLGYILPINFNIKLAKFNSTFCFPWLNVPGRFLNVYNNSTSHKTHSVYTKKIYTFFDFFVYFECYIIILLFVVRKSRQATGPGPPNRPSRPPQTRKPVPDRVTNFITKELIILYMIIIIHVVLDVYLMYKLVQMSK